MYVCLPLSMMGKGCKYYIDLTKLQMQVGQTSFVRPDLYYYTRLYKRTTSRRTVGIFNHDSSSKQTLHKACLIKIS